MLWDAALTDVNVVPNNINAYNSVGYNDATMCVCVCVYSALQ